MFKCTVPLSVLFALTAAAVGAPADKAEAKAAAPAVKGEALKATVVSIKGTAHKRLTSVPNSKWEPLKVAEVLGEMTLIRTGLRSKVVLKMADRGNVTIRRNTKIGIGSFRKAGKAVTTRLGMKYGSINTNVDSSRGPNDFKLKTASTVMAITGTNTNSSFNGDTGYSHQNNSGNSNSTGNNGTSRGTQNGEGTNNDGTRSGDNDKNNADTQSGDTGGGQGNNEQKNNNQNGSGQGQFANGSGPGSAPGLGGGIFSNGGSIGPQNMPNGSSNGHVNGNGEYPSE